MFAAKMNRFFSVLLAMSLIIAPGAHLLFSATSFSKSTAVSSAGPDGNSLTFLCGHSSHGAKCNLPCSAGVVAAAPTLTVAPLRELLRADVAEPLISRHPLAAKARGPPSA
jgi:hypothetical protein